MRHCLHPSFRKAALTFLLSALFSSPALAQNEVCSVARHGATGLEVRMPHQIGIWEEPHFTFTKLKNFSTEPITIQVSKADGAYQGPGVTLLFPDGHQQTHDSDYLDLQKNPPEFPDYLSLIKKLEPKQFFSSDKISLSRLFGKLSAGRYKLRIEVPGERYRVDGQAGGKLDTGWVEFEMIPMSSKVQKVVQQAQLQNVQAKLIPATTSASAKSWIVEMSCELKNGLPSPLEIYCEKKKVLNDVERLDGSLEWRDHNDWIGYCGDGVAPLQIAPGTSSPVIVHLPGDSGIYRVVLSTGPGKLKIYSPPVQIVREREP